MAETKSPHPASPTMRLARRLSLAYAGPPGCEAQLLCQYQVMGRPQPPSVLRTARLCQVRDRRTGTLHYLWAPGIDAARRLESLIERHPDIGGRLILAEPETVRALLLTKARPALLGLAINGLSHRRPKMSARRTFMPAQTLTLIFGMAGLASLFLLFPVPTAILFNLVAAVTFLVAIAARIAATTFAPAPLSSVPYLEDDLPRYTLLVPIYKEAESVEDLAQALSRLDYPARLLDIKLIVEEDDYETIAAIGQIDLAAPFEMVSVPAAEPRTKPKALSYALPLARGDLVVIYDAEDRPEPMQLRKAVASFHGGDEKLACVQAKLVIDNRHESFLSRQFFCEYAGLFEVFLPALSLFNLPIPLGGTSNHFRRDVLVSVGGWDPFNVTEDADLGIRLYRAGYHTAIIDSQTLEEAPTRFTDWSGQRSRWFKGWLQTWLVHMRSPLALWRDLGPAGFFTVQVISLVSVISALVHPFFTLAALAAFGWIFSRPERLATMDAVGHLLLALNLTVFMVGWAGTMAIAAAGVERRRAPVLTRDLVLLPVYWVCLSWGAWKAVVDLILYPHRWVKTPHGSAKRQADDIGTKA